VDIICELFQVRLCFSSVGGAPSFSLLDRSFLKDIRGLLVENLPLE
jgi:hypothetical protein